MRQIEITRADTNPAQLHAELRAHLGQACYGLSVSGSRVRVFLADDTPSPLVAGVAPLVHAHDPGILTPAQEQVAARRALPFFTLAPDALATLADRMDSAAFRQEMVRAFVHLRDLLQT
ncbi:MAG: hypothetical protein JXN59_08310 [Anaerolineae bacterium]|nr:hypothetical protein [Anaerolineae bacterium]